VIPWYQPHFWGKEKEYVVDALESTWISGGKYVDRLESTMASLLGCNHVITTSNGTSSLMLAYLALGLGPGDEIIVPGYTFAAPANMALAIGATPVYADVDPETWLLCPKSVEEKISKKTKAIVPVHIYGNVCDMGALTAIAQHHQLFVIEDVAEAAFSQYAGQQAGTFGDFGSFSFQATKTITTGEGGAICTSSDSLEKAARLLRNHGMRPGKHYWHEVVGHNFRLTNLQAALGCAQLESVDEIILNKKRVYKHYLLNLESMPGLRLQKITPTCEPVMWAVAIKLNVAEWGMTRDQVIDAMTAKGIETRPGFYALSDMPIYQTDILQNSSEIANTVISLPSYTMISNDEIDRICSVFLGLYKARK